MARKCRPSDEQPKSGTASTVPWMITLTDLMTLLMTFFVVLVSLAVFDERSKHYVLESVSSVFGTQEEARLNPYATEFMDDRQVSGPTSERDASLDNIRKLLLGDNPEVRLSQNALVLVLSLNSDILFEPGSVVLSPEGRGLLDKLVPYALQMSHPMRIAGHSSPGLEEVALNSLLNENGAASSSTWGISLERSLAVYQHFLQRGVSQAQLDMEAYGDSRPRFSNNSEEGRRNNRRVDLILDKRNRLFAGATEALRASERENSDYYFKDFRFDLSYPEVPDNGGR